MSSLKSFYDRSDEQFTSLLKDGAKTLREWNSLLATDFDKTLAGIQAVYEAQGNGLVESNAPLMASHGKVRAVLEQAIDGLQTLSLFIQLKMPKMEDGNNFGVTVQLSVLKELKEVVEKLETKLDELPSYLSKRAEAVEKLSLPSTSTTETKTNSSSSSNTSKAGGEKEGDEKEEKNSDSTVRETKVTSTTQSASMLWRQAHVVSIDVAHYAQLKRNLQYAFQSYLVVLDNVEKNEAKLQQPKGSDGGNAFSSMY